MHRLMMNKDLITMVNTEIERGLAKWGKVDKTSVDLLVAALEELGEVAHGVNHKGNYILIQQEIAEVVGILSRLFDMVEEDSEERET